MPWRLEGFQVQNILFVLVERAGDRTAFSAFLGVEGEHTSDCLEEIVAVLFLENSKERVQSVFSQLIRRSFVNVVAVLESPAGKNCQADGKNLCQRRVDVGRIASLLNEIIVDFFRSKKDSDRLIGRFDGVFDEIVVVGNFSGERSGTNDFYLSAFIDEDVLGVYVADLLLMVFEFTAGSHDVVEQIPNLCFEEVFFEFIAVQYLSPEHEFVVIVS